MGERKQHLGPQFNNGQAIENFLRAPGDVTIAQEANNERRERSGQAIPADLVPDTPKMRHGFFQISVLIRLPKVDERIMRIFQPLSRESFTKRVQRFDHAGKARVSAEKDHTCSCVVCDLLVLDELTAHLHHPLEHRHVVRLALDGV